MGWLSYTFSLSLLVIQKKMCLWLSLLVVSWLSFLCWLSYTFSLSLLVIQKKKCVCGCPDCPSPCFNCFCLGCPCWWCPGYLSCVGCPIPFLVLVGNPKKMCLWLS